MDGFGIDSIDARAAVLVHALRHDPVTQWVTASPSRYDIAYGTWLQDMVAHAEHHPRGSVRTDAETTVVQIWYTIPAGEPPTVLDEEQSHRVLAAFGPDADRFQILIEKMDHTHPVTATHAYLPLIGADPARQGRGYGTAALTSVLDELDAAGTPAYLEASNRANRALYKRLGFRDCAEPLALPDGPELYPMWRPTTAEMGERAW